MSPAFTSAKVRLMVPFMEEVGMEMKNVLKEKIKDSGKGAAVQVPTELFLNHTLYPRGHEHTKYSNFLGAMRDREKSNIVRNDMINILAEVKREWSGTDLVAQAALFLFDDFETSSTSMLFLLYELAVNPDVQNRLLEEIRDYDVKNGGKIDYK